MQCSTCRLALSARLDDEDPPVGAAAVDDHLARCPACRRWHADAAALSRSLRVREAEAVPDLSAAILAAGGGTARRPRSSAVPLLRLGLVAMCLTQVVVALTHLLVEGHGVELHTHREHGAWELALGAGFLAAAWRPRQAAGLLPVVAVLAVALAMTSGLDVASQHTSLLDEQSHLLPLAGVVVLWLLQRTSGPTPTGRRRVLTPT
jgi:predicted anti-sigma-YlaC factor YlaD